MSSCKFVAFCAHGWDMLFFSKWEGPVVTCKSEDFEVGLCQGDQNTPKPYILNICYIFRVIF